MSEEGQSGAVSQVQAVAEKVITAPKPPLDAGEKEKPKVVFDSPLQLTARQEDRLITHALARISTLENELGRG